MINFEIWGGSLRISGRCDVNEGGLYPFCRKINDFWKL